MISGRARFKLVDVEYKMNKFKSQLVAAPLGIAAAGVSSGARANVLVDVYIYNGAVNGTLADAATAALAAANATAHYEFTYSSLGAIQWSTNASANTAGQFLGATGLANIGTFVTGNLVNFMNQ